MELNNSFDPIDIALSGMQAQNKNIGLISSNVANAQSTDKGDGTPYRRLEAIFKADGDDGIGGVTLDDISTDMSELPRVLKPGHPAADEQGYVAMPNVDLPVEMINLTMAARAYQANVAVMKRYQRMVDTTLELLR
jgi:flagellar basal-body rod protein FlgC